MLGKIIFRHSDKGIVADLFAALSTRYPTKGLELTRDGDLHLIRAAGDSTAPEAFIAGVGWEQNRAAMAGIHGDGIGEMDSNGNA